MNFKIFLDLVFRADLGYLFKNIFLLLTLIQYFFAVYFFTTLNAVSAIKCDL